MFQGLLYNGWQVLLVGSNANNSVKAGVFYVNSNNSSSNAHSNIGSHLCLLISTIYIITLALAKTQSNASFSLVATCEELEVK